MPADDPRANAPTAIEQLTRHDPTCPGCGVEGDEPCKYHGDDIEWFVRCHLCTKVKHSSDPWRALYELAFHYDRRHRGWTDPKPCPYFVFGQLAHENGGTMPPNRRLECGGVEGHTGPHQVPDDAWVRSLP